MRSWSLLVLALCVAGLGGSGSATGALAVRSAALCDLPARAVSATFVSARAGRTLPPGALRGLAHELRQYPDVPLATRAQLVAAEHLRADARRAARAWRDPRAAIAAGFAADRPPGRSGERTIGFLHAEHRRFSADGRHLDPRGPETLIYANAPGRPLVLVGVMFSVPRGVRGRTPGGPVTRWHSHLVCARGDLRGLGPRPDGTCPPGTKRRRGSEMMHLWFTRDLRSAFAIHAPEPELCAARLLPAAHCGSGDTLRTM
jgi:hypothetical protein